MLEQTGISGKQFAHLLIRSYQEKNQNRFPDIEKIADLESEQILPLKVSDIRRLYKKHGLKIKWFNQNKINTNHPQGKNKMLLRSFFESKNKVYINEALKDDAKRLKYDMATHLGHKILHGGDGLRSLSHQEVVASRVRAQVLPFNHMMCYWHGMTLNQVFCKRITLSKKSFQKLFNQK